MKKYRIYGTTTVSVVKEVWANSKDEAYDKAYEQLPLLAAYCGNGGDDKLVGVEEEGESVEVFDDIEYDEAKEIEDDPDYFECPECGERCLMLHDDDGTFYWGCASCDGSFDKDGNAFDPFFDEIELNDEEDEE